jgi:hypothetical protein
MRTNAAHLIGLACAVLAAVAAGAQEIDTLSGSAGPGFNEAYNDGDLILVFFSDSDASGSSGINSHGDLLFDLGPATNFTGLAPGVYSMAAFNGSATSGQPAVGSGSIDLNDSLTVPSSSTYWTVMGSNQTTNELWLTGTTAQAQQSASTQNTLAGIIGTIGSTGSGNANSDGSAYDGSQTTGDYLLQDEMWQNFSAPAATSVSSSSDRLVLYQLLPGTDGKGSSTELGYFTLSDNTGVESLTFTVPPSQAPQTGPAARLVNISSRAFVGTGASLEIAGFVISGPAGSTEQVLIRGDGPALAQFGVGGVLTQPVLTLYDSSGKQLASNTGWTTSPNATGIESAAAETGAFAFPSGSADSAILVSLAPGAYTAEIVGANGTTGVALAEVYEVSNGTADLINISTRAFVGTESNVEIGGFVVRGSQPEKVLIRAVGPTLSEFGVTGLLAQPSLSVVDSSGNTVATNTGWSNNSDAAAISFESEAAGAFSLSSGSADCALLLTLPPGAYTAVVSGANGTSGVALVEVYQAP